MRSKAQAFKSSIRKASKDRMGPEFKGLIRALRALQDLKPLRLE
jgi:hypothetical protein